MKIVTIVKVIKFFTVFSIAFLFLSLCVWIGRALFLGSVQDFVGGILATLGCLFLVWFGILVFSDEGSADDSDDEEDGGHTDSRLENPPDLSCDPVDESSRRPSRFN